MKHKKAARRQLIILVIGLCRVVRLHGDSPRHGKQGLHIWKRPEPPPGKQGATAELSGKTVRAAGGHSVGAGKHSKTLPAAVLS